jgi:hypothetical protein
MHEIGICAFCAQCAQAAYMLLGSKLGMNEKQDKKTASNETDFFERFGVGEHLEHPSFALDDCDFEGLQN